MNDVKFVIENGNQFVCRAIGIIKKENKVLLQGRKGKNTWGFPGGSVAYFESSKETIIRELKEEIGADVKRLNLFAVVENFFNYLNNYDVHQISFYYLVDLDENNEVYKLNEFDGIEDGKGLVFRWFDIDTDAIVKPKIILDELKKGDNSLRHIILKEIG